MTTIAQLNPNQKPPKPSPIETLMAALAEARALSARDGRSDMYIRNEVFDDYARARAAEYKRVQTWAHIDAIRQQKRLAARLAASVAYANAINAAIDRRHPEPLTSHLSPLPGEAR